ncbi:MAG: hypothetical protein GY694_04035, partial [Gammaproteobacteria bacterium]|nr:hypothetical protein [Gammaproteobacteria bacterium]
YKIVIQNIVDSEELMSQHLGTLLPEACYKSITTLSLLLIERYQQYLSEPGKVWYDLNQIYLLTEQLGIDDLKINDKHTTLNAYLKIVTIRLSDPYRLMRSEVRSLNRLMDEWVEYTSIESIANKDLTICHVVDLAKDCTPGTIYSVFSHVPKEPRVININRLIIHIEQQLRAINANQEEGLNSLILRQESEMLLRMKKQFSYLDSVRKERQSASDTITLIAGISACHYFISGEKLFAPEEEIKKANAADESTSSLSILSFEEQELLENDNRTKQLNDVNPFLSENMFVNDNWEKINMTSLTNANIHSVAKAQNKLYKKEQWQQKNEHNEGMLLSCDTQSSHSLNVGMLVGYHPSKTHQDLPVYQLGIIRWLRLHLKTGMTIGIMKLSGDYTSVAVKATAGVGQGSSYNQALIKQELRCNELILPAGIYDIGTVLDIWDQEDIFSVIITKKIINTNSVMLVQYENSPS